MPISVDSNIDNLPSFESWDGAAEFDREDEPTRVMRAFSTGSFFSSRFQIKDELGSGGMGTVYAAIDLETNREIALKVLKKSGSESAERFRREAEILAAMDHPGIVDIYGFGAADDGTLWLSMEHLLGETLRERVQRAGPMDPAMLCPIVTATCAALSAAHARGVIHRDLKPDNIFLTLPRDGQPAGVRLLDFGLSLSVNSKKLTKTGTMIGTPRYMAPEQIKSAHASGAPADVYALGIICYEVLTGQSPFSASDHGQLLGAILTGRTQPLSEVKPELPEAIGECLDRAMAPKVEDRYATPEEFALAFADAASIYMALRHTPEPVPVRGKPTVRMADVPSGVKRDAAAIAAAAAREADATIPTEAPRFSAPDGLPVAQPVKRRRAEKKSVPAWMIPVALLAAAALMGTGAFIAYMLVR